MSRPRQVVPREFYLVTRRCTQRQFLLRPDDETNNAFVYCLAEAAQRFEVDIVLTLAEANHHHTCIFDRYGRYPQFIEHFHKMLARCMNARWGRWENLWAAEEPCVTRLLGRETVIQKLIYAASNPVKDRLVQRAYQWPGVSSYRNLLSGEPLKAIRPRHFFRDNGVMPDVVTLMPVIPQELGDRDTVIAEVRAGVEAIEREVLERRAQTGARVLGVRAIRAQSWRASPKTMEPRRNLRPRFAGQTDERVAAVLAYKEFLVTYRDARKAWIAGKAPLFPSGTYWLARFAPVAVGIGVPLAART